MYSASKIRKPWGTITHPKERNPGNLLGYQKLSGEQVKQMIDRLYQEDWHQKREKKRVTQLRNENTKGLRSKKTAAEVEEIVARLTRNSEKNVTDSNRTGAMKEMGIYNTYACKGWN